jgi:hypothetical protein
MTNILKGMFELWDMTTEVKTSQTFTRGPYMVIFVQRVCYILFPVQRVSLFYSTFWQSLISYYTCNHLVHFYYSTFVIIRFSNNLEIRGSWKMRWFSETCEWASDFRKFTRQRICIKIGCREIIFVWQKDYSVNMCFLKLYICTCFICMPRPSKF